ncbi:hypothetical protein [Pseudochelatococcus sp. B33]
MTASGALAAATPIVQTTAALPGEDRQRVVAVLPGAPEVLVLADDFLAPPTRERSGGDRQVVRLPTPAVEAEAVTPVVVTRSRSGAPVIPSAVLANWTQDIAFLSSRDAEEVRRGLGNFLRSDNRSRDDDPGAYLTSVRDGAFAGAAYGQEMASSLRTELDEILGSDKQGPVLVATLTSEQQKALVETAHRLVDRLLDSGDAVSVFRRAGDDYLKVSGQYARRIAAERGSPATLNKAITTLYINNLFLRGACSALNHAAADMGGGDRRLAVVAALVQRLVNGADSPHVQVTDPDVVRAYGLHRDAVQGTLRAALEKAGAPFVS